MFQVTLRHRGFLQVTEHVDLLDALARARFLRCVYFGYENEIPPADASILIKFV